MSHRQGTNDPVLEVQDRWGRPIWLIHRVWLDHVQFAHPELRGNLAAIRETLIDPDIVTHDMSRPDAECFYRLGIVPNVAHRHLKVVVRFIARDDGLGFVNTAYISRNVRKREPVKWQK